MKVFIISIVLIASVFLLLGIKLFFYPKAKVLAHSCRLEAGNIDNAEECTSCQLKDLFDCPRADRTNDQNKKVTKKEFNTL
jgi:hypothetical protein